MSQYSELSRILQDAHNQASGGKGKERHANDEPFEQQQICVIARWLKGNPCAAPLFQAIKKAAETTRLRPEAAIHELYGAIIYTAAAIKLFEEILEVEDAEVAKTGFFQEGFVCPSCETKLHMADMECPNCGRVF